MSIYFVQCGLSGRVKIGFSKKMDERVQMLRSAHATPLTLLRSVAGDKTLERAFHVYYHERRKHGEWFEFCPTMRKVSIATVTAFARVNGSLPKPTRERSERKVQAKKLGPIHPLRRWLFYNQMKLVDFGKQCGVSHTNLSNYMNWLQTPSMTTVIRIRDATNGAVQPNDFAPPLAAKPRKRRAAGATP